MYNVDRIRTIRRCIIGYTETDLAAALPSLRPALIRVARRLRRCSWEDAEDLVSETVLIALPLLSQYDPSTGSKGLRPWLLKILYRVIREDRKREARHMETAPLEAAVSIAASEPFTLSRQVRELFRSLPHNERILVNEWLAGYSQLEIARRHRLHRNTVRIRLELSFCNPPHRVPQRRSARLLGMSV